MFFLHGNCVIGGSLLSLGKETKGLKTFAKAVSHKVSTLPGRGKKKKGEEPFGTIPEQHAYNRPKQNRNEADPGVVSDDEDEFRVSLDRIPFRRVL